MSILPGPASDRLGVHLTWVQVSSRVRQYSYTTQTPSTGGSKKVKKVHMLNSEDKKWLVSHMTNSPEQIEKLYGDFHQEYKNGGIFRKYGETQLDEYTNGLSPGSSHNSSPLDLLQ